MVWNRVRSAVFKERFRILNGNLLVLQLVSAGLSLSKLQLQTVQIPLCQFQICLRLS